MDNLTKFGKFLVIALTLAMIGYATLFTVASNVHQADAVASSGAPLATGADTSNPLLQQTPGDIVLGDPKAPVTIIEYASLSCSHCAYFHNEILPELETLYINTGKVKLINRPFPLNAPALKGAMLAGCAGKDRYYAFLKVMFETQKRWAFTPSYESELKQIARVGGMSDEAFERCMNDKKLEDNLVAVRKQAEEKLHVESTPTFFVNGRLVAGAQPVSAFTEIIEPLLP